MDSGQLCRGATFLTAVAVVARQDAGTAGVGAIDGKAKETDDAQHARSFVTWKVCGQLVGI